MVRTLLSRAALLLGGVVLSLVLIELGLRIVGYAAPRFYTSDEFTGVALLPGAEGWYRGEGESYVRISSQGLHDREHAVAKPSGTVRIAVLGDSITEAIQVAQDENFTSLLQRDLGSCASLNGRTVETMNFGVSRYGTAQELETLRHRVWQFSPDVVVLAFFNGNDVRNNSQALEGDYLRPYLVHVNGQLMLDDSFRRTSRFRFQQSLPGQVFYRFRNESRVVQVLTDAQSQILPRLRGGAPAAAPAEGELADAGLDNGIFAPPAPADTVRAEAWSVTEDAITLMRDEVVARGATFLTVQIGSPVQVHPDPAARQRLMDSLGVQALDYPEQRLGATAAERGIPLLQLTPSFLRYASEHQVALHGFGKNLGIGHLNQEGHQLASQLIAQRLCGDGLGH